jgi:hypothetical protein
LDPADDDDEGEMKMIMEEKRQQQRVRALPCHAGPQRQEVGLVKAWGFFEGDDRQSILLEVPASIQP